MTIFQKLGYDFEQAPHIPDHRYVGLYTGAEILYARSYQGLARPDRPYQFEMNLELDTTYVTYSKDLIAEISHVHIQLLGYTVKSFSVPPKYEIHGLVYAPEVDTLPEEYMVVDFDGRLVSPVNFDGYIDKNLVLVLKPKLDKFLLVPLTPDITAVDHYQGDQAIRGFSKDGSNNLYRLVVEGEII